MQLISNTQILFPLIVVSLLLSSPGCLGEQQQPESIIPYEWLDIYLEISVANSSDNWSISLPIPQLMENGKRTSLPAESGVIMAASSEYLSIDGDENESWLVVSGSGSQILTFSADAEVESGHHIGGRQFSLFVREPAGFTIGINVSAPDGSEAILQWKHKWISNSICSTRAHYLIGIDDDVGAPAYNEYKFVMEPNLNNASLIESTSGCRI